MRHECLADWLSWLETLHPSAIDLGLTRVAAAATAAGLGSAPFPLITVAGTNGKGSVCALLEAALSEAGYRVGSYSSPHLSRFNERIRVARQEASDAEIAAALERIDQQRGDTSLTYFEFTTLAAMEIFQRCEVDVAVLEVGLGGRLDAVNIWDADVAVVTAIAVDHIDWLGDDREVIGGEKAAIARAGRPLVCGDPQPPASIAARAAEIGAPLRQLGSDFSAQRGESASWAFHGSRRQWDGLPAPGLSGAWQYHNAATALEALSQLETQLPVSAEAIARALRGWSLPGRFERYLCEGVEIIFDVAHNPHAVGALAEALRHTGTGRCLAVAGFMGDKAVAEMLELIAAQIDTWHLAELPLARALPPATLAALLHEQGPISRHADVATALKAARSEAQPGDRILVFGSFVTVGAGREAYFSQAQGAAA